MDHAATHDAHADGHATEEFHPHVTPLWIYLATWGALMVLTALTYYASTLDLGAANLAIALLVATTKATLVALFFMHLRWDLRFHAIIFSFSIIFLAIFIVFTMYDTETRGRNDPVQADRPLDVANPYGGGSRQKEKLEMKYAVDPHNAEHGEKIDVRVVAPPAEPPR
jgi:cytochrome c oxidase subunit 4